MLWCMREHSTYRKPYSHYSIFFITYLRAQLNIVLHYSKIERVAKDKHSSLLDLFISYKENELL